MVISSPLGCERWCFCWWWHPPLFSNDELLSLYSNEPLCSSLIFVNWAGILYSLTTTNSSTLWRWQTPMPFFGICKWLQHHSLLGIDFFITFALAALLSNGYLISSLVVNDSVFINDGILLSSVVNIFFFKKKIFLMIFLVNPLSMCTNPIDTN